MLTCESQNRTFFEQIQTNSEIDKRDSRGLRHDLAIILVGVSLAILSKRDGILSSIHRHMTNHYNDLCTFLDILPYRVVSRSQLPEVLKNVNVSVFDELLFSNYGINLTQIQKQWFSVDGKELRGSIEKGNKRGEAIVLAVTHNQMLPQAQQNYSGQKESEIPVVRKLLKESELEKQKISMDALHCNPETLTQINQAGGTYLVGLKSNQENLLQDSADLIRFSKPQFTYCQKEIDKVKHGRQEIREYNIYDFGKEYKDERWKNAQIETLIQVKRDLTNCKTATKSVEISYYLSNQKDNYEELCIATRNHWTVETNNYVRDVTFAEDKLKSKEKELQRTIALNRTIANILINQGKFSNKRAQIENFADDFNSLLRWLRKLNFL
jgi:predicted transposase YbfD/YdcC